MQCILTDFYFICLLTLNLSSYEFFYVHVHAAKMPLVTQ